MVIKHFVNSLGANENAEAYCCLSEGARMRLKLNKRIKPTVNYSIICNSAKILSVYHEYRRNLDIRLQIMLICNSCISQKKAGSSEKIGAVSYTHLDVYKRQVCYAHSKFTKTN